MFRAVRALPAIPVPPLLFSFLVPPVFVRGGRVRVRWGVGRLVVGVGVWVAVGCL